MSVVPLVFNLTPGQDDIVTTAVTGNFTLKATDQRVEIDATSGNITITLPTITAAFKNKSNILFKRIDTTSNTVTFVGTGGNYEDENLQIGNDPQLESIKIYASNDNTWRRDGYGLPEQRIYYRNLSTGLIIIGSGTDDPANLLTDNGDGTIDVNFGGEFRIVDRVNEDNTTPVLNNRPFKIRSRIVKWVATANINHIAAGSDGEFWITVDENSTIEITLSTTGSLLVPVFSDSGINLNTHLQLGGMVKTSGTVDVLESAPVVDNNIPNTIRHIARNAIGVINSADESIEIDPIAGTIQLALNEGITFTGAPGQWLASGGLTTNFFRSVATSPVSIFTIDRAGDGNIVSISTSANVTEFESSPGVFSSIGASKAANRFYQSELIFITELLGQKTFSGGARLTDAAADNEPLDIPGLTSLLPKVVQISVDNASTDLSLTAQAIFTLLKQFR